MPIPADILNARILVVDDQAANVLLLERILHGAGYLSVTSTRDPLLVRDLHRRNNYDVILLDLQMPVMDGLGVMEGLKEIETSGWLPVLVITAQPDQRLKALRAGARDFVSKPFDIDEVLVRVKNLIEVRLFQQGTKRLYEMVLAEQRATERLLRNVLPHAIAERLKGRPEVTANAFSDVIADKFEEVSIIFADIVGFTKFSEGVTPEILVEVLNEIFTLFDGIADRRGLEKIKTMGDAYMAAAGLPEPADDNACRAAHMALDMLEAMDRFNAGSRFKLNVRIGIDTGPAVAGVIGKRKFLYDLWGDAVNTASRMESHGVSGRIQVTESTQKRLGSGFQLEQRGVIDVKGKGEMHTWFLNGRAAFSEMT